MNKQRAFPLPMLPDENWTGDGDVNGMLLRDYFAAKAMQAAYDRQFDLEFEDRASDAEIAKAAFMVADAMLQERDK